MKSESNMAEHQETNILLRPDGLELTRAAVDAAGLASAGEMSRVLDIGCGAGQTIEFLQGYCSAQLFGIDISERAVHIAAEKVPSAHIVCGDAHELPWDDSTFDMVLLECVLTILSYPELALKEACRVLRPGGWLIISTLYDKTNSGSHELVERGLISVSVLEDALEDHGLTIVDDRECSDCLKQFFGDVIFRFGSLEAYIRSATALIGSTVLQCDIPVRRCGYMLVISQKR